MPDWLAVKRIKYVCFLTLNDSINYMKYFLNCLHHTSVMLQPFLLLIAANLAQAGFFGPKMELMVCADLVGGKRSKSVFFLTLYDSINDMKY